MTMCPDDDDLAEIDTTPEEYARYKAESEPARLIDPPVGRPYGIVLAESSAAHFSRNYLVSGSIQLGNEQFSHR